MCDKALWDSFLRLERNVDKYKSNWGSLLEYIDMSASANVADVLVSALGKVANANAQEHCSAKLSPMQSGNNPSNC